MQCSAAHAVDKELGAMIDKPRDQVGVSPACDQVKRCDAVEVAIIDTRPEVGCRQLKNSATRLASLRRRCYLISQ